MQALTLVQCVYFPALGIGDAQIVQCNDAAAELYGYENAPSLAGRFMSDLQESATREAGRARWVLRHEGHDVPAAYCSLVRRPDGEVVGHRGTLVSTMQGMHGESYLASVECVRELDEPPIPDLDTYGISPDQAEKHTGQFTVAAVRALLQAGHTLPCGERFTTIVQECERLSTLYYGWAPGRGLDFALRSDLCTWSLSEKAQTRVYTRHYHPSCGRAWDGQTPKATQCPSCRAHCERLRTSGEMAGHGRAQSTLSV